tara:strand:- start:5 stop:289 length:285 start_codon:yes stop_codon:yes gene_type:complete
MIKEYNRIENSHPDCKTEFVKGDLVVCNIGPLYLTESIFDCGKRKDDIGIVLDVTFWQVRMGRGDNTVICCELEVFWFEAQKSTFHLDKYIHKA